jgi:hypothetical protein
MKEHSFQSQQLCVVINSTNYITHLSIY